MIYSSSRESLRRRVAKAFLVNVPNEQKWNNVRPWHWRENLDASLFFLGAAGTLSNS